MKSKKITFQEIRDLYPLEYNLYVNDSDIKKYLKNLNSHFEDLQIGEWKLKHKVIRRIISKIPNIKESWLEKKIKKILFEKSEYYYGWDSKCFLALEKVIDILDDKSDEELDELAKKDDSKWSTYKQWIKRQEYGLKICWKEDLVHEFMDDELDYL